MKKLILLMTLILSVMSNAVLASDGTIMTLDGTIMTLTRIAAVLSGTIMT